jgi:hypothetical protein
MGHANTTLSGMRSILLATEALNSGDGWMQGTDRARPPVLDAAEQLGQVVTASTEQKRDFELKLDSMSLAYEDVRRIQELQGPILSAVQRLGDPAANGPFESEASYLLEAMSTSYHAARSLLDERDSLGHLRATCVEMIAMIDARTLATRAASHHARVVSYTSGSHLERTAKVHIGYADPEGPHHPLFPRGRDAPQDRPIPFEAGPRPITYRIEGSASEGDVTDDDWLGIRSSCDVGPCL